MRQRLGTEPPEDDMSIGARMLRLRDPDTGNALPDERLLPHIGMICELRLAILFALPIGHRISVLMGRESFASCNCLSCTLSAS